MLDLDAFAACCTSRSVTRELKITDPSSCGFINSLALQCRNVIGAVDF